MELSSGCRATWLGDYSDGAAGAAKLRAMLAFHGLNLLLPKVA